MMMDLGIQLQNYLIFILLTKQHRKGNTIRRKPKNSFNVGSLGLSNLKAVKLINKKEIEKN